MPRSAPLDGVTVLDLSIFLAGPFCTQILADLGAEVIKVEAPTGDPTRSLPPYEHRGESAYFLSANRNKKSVVLDLTTAVGRAAATELAARSDVVVENFRPGVAAKLGMDWATLAPANPRLIGCSISGFGQDGPDAQRPAYDMVVQAISGGMSITGERGGRPVRSGLPIADLNAGQFAALAIAAALLERGRSGLGQYIDISMLDVQISLLSYQAAYHLIGGAEPGPQGRGHDSIPTYAAFLTRDQREVLVCANTERMWTNLVDVLELAYLRDDPRYRTNADRHRNRDTLESLLERAFAIRDADPLLAALIAAGVPAAAVNTVGQALADPQVRSRGMVHSVQHTLGGSVELIGNPMRFSRSAQPEPVSPPTLGQHTEEILHRIGYGVSSPAHTNTDNRRDDA
jgi:CoA:oxalate CoA-transferase